uniref:Uncharacterized protein n=1 Tax=Solanum lycopersicum TaxID=4081 RepID=A0A3Q7EWJ8_SOLLC
MMDVYITFRFYHGGKLQQKPRIKNEGVKEDVAAPPAIGYLNDVGRVDGESNATFNKESSHTLEGSEGLGFEEAAQHEEPIVGEELGRTFAHDGEELAGRERGTATSVTRRGRKRGTGVAATTTTDVPGDTGRVKRTRVVVMGIVHTYSGFTIHNPEIPTNSSIVTLNLGHCKTRSGLKWKGKTL